MDDELTFELAADELELFLQEVNEHLQTLEAGLLSLESGTDQDALNAIFRAAHTLKAIAGAIGHRRMAETTHALETIFDALREGELTPSPALLDDLLITVDALRALRDEVSERRPSNVPLAALLARLQELAAGLEQAVGPQHMGGPNADQPFDPALTPRQAAQSQSAADAGHALLAISVEADPQSFAPGARLLQAALAAAELGQLIAQRPTEQDLLEDRHEGTLWALLATTADVATLEALLGDVSELRTVHVSPYRTGPETASLAARRPAARQGQPGDKTVRISIERLDVLMDMVGELVSDRARLAQIETTLRGSYGKGEQIGLLNDTIAHLGRVINQLQGEVMQARMLPIAQLFDKLPRLVRDGARGAGKQVSLAIGGAGTELDRAIIEALSDPLIHLLRNAIDHGIEPPQARRAAGKLPAGTIAVNAEHIEGQVILTVQDDGGGIDPDKTRQAAVRCGLLSEDEAARLSHEEAIALIFQPGMSTAEAITETSGRGVGLDIVRTNISRIGGVVMVESEPGRGTTFRLTLPLTLAIMQTMLVSLRDDVYAIPMRSIVESLYLSDVSLSSIKGLPAISWRDEILPLLSLQEFFPHPSARAPARPGKKAAIVVVSWGKLQAGLIVDRIMGKQEIVVKPFDQFIGTVPGLSGCTTMGDGRVALIVDVPGMINVTVRSQRGGRTP